MKTNVGWVVLVGLCLTGALGACSAGDDDDTPEGDKFELRLTGRDSAGYEQVLLGVSRIEVMAQGKPLVFQLGKEARAMELTREDHAYLLGNFYLPKAAEEAEVIVHFDDVGAFKEAGSSGLINARSGAILFKSKRVELEKRKHAVIELHLKDSLFQARSARVLLPSTFIVH
ncbi:hypothetical protein LZ198_28660 [Myxococcus sp. K15C18031901]|uniref:hypothetical protein n=1 Tax=Myxococcus dinghuensis TaxID=2906761 RepID=UPI0020A6DE64|nr:hypothetical protein [Myxococcus dinghuensis]MCP3102856.1 hypothetical protein [Myxococcus dinghuensis]